MTPTLPRFYRWRFFRIAHLARAGRVHIRTKQPGMGGVPAEALRYSVGDIPTRARNRELKEPTLSKPTRKQISVMVRLAARSRSLARSIRRRVRYVLGVSP